MKWSFSFLLYNCLCYFHIASSNYDLTLIGPIDKADGIGTMAITWFNMLKNYVDIDLIPCGRIVNADVPNDLRIRNPQEKNNITPRVGVLLCQPDLENAPNLVPESPIKIAYSMYETTHVPITWVNVFNKQFDLIVVPDNWLVKTYRDSGVKIPIFVLPIPIELNNFFATPPRIIASKPFIFGMSSGYVTHKNHKLIIDAFLRNFKNNPDVGLIIHGNLAIDEYYNSIVKYVHETNSKNITILKSRLSSNDYINFMQGIDCFVLLSKAEGFSMTPREALAMGLPCILSNNTAHATICASGLVKAVKSEHYEQATAPFKHGNYFSCTLEDASTAMLDVYNNYQAYLERAQEGRKWAMQYTPENLRTRYLNLVKPKTVIFGSENIATDEFLMTDSLALHEKYVNLLQHN